MSSTVIQANQRSSEPTSGHPSQSQRSSKPINGHPSRSMVIRANQRSSEAINGPRWQLISIRGSQWPSMAISELAHLRAVLIRYSSEAIRGHPRSSEVIRDHQRSSELAHLRAPLVSADEMQSRRRDRLTNLWPHAAQQPPECARVATPVVRSDKEDAAPLCPASGERGCRWCRRRKRECAERESAPLAAQLCAVLIGDSQGESGARVESELAHLMRHAIRGHQRSSEVIRGHQSSRTRMAAESLQKGADASRTQ